MIKDEDKVIFLAVGKEFERRREAVGLSQRALAVKAGTTHTAVQDIEKGKAAGYNKFFKLAAALDTSGDEIYQAATANGNGTSPNGQLAHSNAPAPRRG